MPDREYNSSDEDSVTTDSNAGQEEEEDSSDYESSDDETTLPQVTTLESVLAMIPFTPDWCEAASKFNLCFNSGSLEVCVRCCSLQSVECISRRSCPSLGRKHGRGAEIARRE